MMSATTAELLTCKLCGTRDEGVILDWARLREGTRPFRNIERCADRVACRARVDQQGKPWPLLDPGQA